MACSAYWTGTQMIERQIDRVPGSARVSGAGWKAWPLLRIPLQRRRAETIFLSQGTRLELPNAEEKFAIARTRSPARDTRALRRGAATACEHGRHSPAANPARHSNPPTLRLRSDHCDTRRAMRSPVFLRRTRQLPAGENEVRRSRLFRQAGKSPAPDSPLRSLC